MAHWLKECDETNNRRFEHTWVRYEEISTHVIRAVIVAEDSSFVTHRGFDWESIRHAIRHNRAGNRPLIGASTISQQLAKNLFLTGKQSIVRKIQEAAITAAIELVMPKRRILELYLNVVEWGVGIFGVGAAARHHFGVAAADLDRDQAAFLAAILPDPRSYDGASAPPPWQQIQRIIERMPRARFP